jgi:hypothetical protein
MSVVNNLKNLNRNLTKKGNDLLERTTNFGKDLIIFL